jgi:peptide/nickel transport system ATP-binding protein
VSNITITNEAGTIDKAASAALSASPLVEVTDLDIAFRRGGAAVSALRGVSLSVAPGEIVGLVGESGSGKSVLGLSLLGLIGSDGAPTTSGSAVVCGTDMVRASPEERRQTRKEHLGAVFQDPMTSLNPTMRVGYQVAEAAGSIEEAERLLASVGVPDPHRRLRAYPHELSGGLRQRVMIAMAIAGRPSFVIADEPTTALDVTVQSQILELIARLRDELGTSFLFITHDLGVAAEIADRIVVLYAGRLAELGPSGVMFGSPSHPYTAGLLRSRLLLSTDRTRPIQTLPGEPPDPRAHPAGCAFAPRCDFRIEKCSTVPPLVAIPEPEGPHFAACWALDRTRAAVHRVASEPWPPSDSPKGAPAVVVSRVEKSFPIRHGLRREQLHALRGVDLEVREGEAVALVGESGCGKSTLLRVIAGLQRPDAGGVDIGRGARPQMVFQDAGASLTPWMTIGDLIGERLLEEPLDGAQRRARVAASLALVGLPVEVAGAKASQLSGGQRQRVALARATVVPPKVLLCDEPTSALDVSLAATVLNLLGRLRRELGIAMIFVTHDLAAARVVADRIAVMYLGRIVDIGTADEICTDPIHPYATALLSTIPGATGRIRLAGDPANALAPPPGCAFHPRCPAAIDACSVEDPSLTVLGDGPWGRRVACPVVIAERGLQAKNSVAGGNR